MREEIKKNALLAKQQQNATISVEIVGLGDAQELLSESQATPEKASRDEEKEQEMQKLLTDREIAVYQCEILNFKNRNITMMVNVEDEG